METDILVKTLAAQSVEIFLLSGQVESAKKIINDLQREILNLQEQKKDEDTDAES